LSPDHQCPWREKAETLEKQLATMQEKLEQLTGSMTNLQRHVFGKRSEKMPPVAHSLRDAEADSAAALEKRRENAAQKRQLVTREIHHQVREDQKTCPKCGGHEFTPLGEGKSSEVYELVPACIERQVHIQEKLRCRCGEGIITAEGPRKVYDKARFGPALMAQVAVFRYTTWRDTKLAIVMFVEEKGLTEIIAKAAETLKGHAQFASAKDAGYETELRAMMKWPGDDARKVTMHCLFIHTPRP
jgi:hypothetical protein